MSFKDIKGSENEKKSNDKTWNILEVENNTSSLNHFNKPMILEDKK
jgi:hypothetical protein